MKYDRCILRTIMFAYVDTRVSNPVRQKFEAYLKSTMAFAKRKGLDLRFEVVGIRERGLTVTDRDDPKGFRFGYSLVMEMPDDGIPEDAQHISDIVYAGLRDAVWNTPFRNVDDREDCFVVRLQDRNDTSIVHECQVSLIMRDVSGRVLYRYQDMYNGGYVFRPIEGTEGYDELLDSVHGKLEDPFKKIRRACKLKMNDDPERCTALIYAEVIRDLAKDPE